MKNITYKIVQLSTPEELHTECMEWNSQLDFIKDEHYFLNELIKNYTIPLISEAMYDNSLSLVANLNSAEKERAKLQKRAKEHINNIAVLLDSKPDDRSKKAFKEIHYYLKVDIHQFMQVYQGTKEALFGKIKQIIKQDKSKRLLN